MGARDLLHELQGAGLSVKLIDDRIIVAPKDRLTDPLRDAIRANRDELVFVLKPDVPTTAAPVPTPPSARIYRLTRAQADGAHADPWDGATIARFQARAGMFQRRGFCADDADDLAEMLALRDREGDDRHMCRECRELAPSGRCRAAARGDVPGAGRPMEPVLDILVRCPSFKAAASAHPSNQGIEDANHND